MPRRSALALLIAAATGPLAAQAEPAREITGRLGYLARIALPPNAEAVVVLQGAFGTVLGQAVIPTEGRQVPLPFTLEAVPGLSGRMDAAIRIDGQTRWLIEDVAVPAGEAPLDLGDLILSPYQALAFATEFDCGGTRVSIGMLDDRLTLRADRQDLPLTQIEAASGARYVAEGDDSTGIWSKGDNALVTLSGAELPECFKLVPPDAAPYRAGGIEPGWSVRLGDGTAEITADYGQIALTAPRPAAMAVPGGYVFDMPGIGARLSLTEGICRDLATGMPHPHAATLTLGERTLSGCGGDPASLLTGGEWRIEDVAGTGIIDASNVTLRFGKDGRISGSAGCNRMIGGYTLTGEGLSFSQMGMTMMACPEALMAQERRVLDALASVRRFDIDATGALLLIGGPEDKPVLTARRP
ncbi:MAG: META domain-containing protein [Rhodobacteraceae bacterium]|nr:MAG: META domain-containing protein [Paracoccaceae bacterium]